MPLARKLGLPIFVMMPVASARRFIIAQALAWDRGAHGELAGAAPDRAKQQALGASARPQPPIRRAAQCE